MHIVLRKKCARTLLTQFARVATTVPRTYADDADDIKLPPEPTTCCMSGCANCVWIDYASEVSQLLDGNTEKTREIVLDKITDPNLKMFLNLELRTMQPIKKSEDTEDKS